MEASIKDLNPYFKSDIEQDRAPVVICDLEHIILYMNPSAMENYSKYGGGELVGKSLLDCHNSRSCEKITEVVGWFGESKENNIMHTFYNRKRNKDVYMVALRDGSGRLIGYYEKHEDRTCESERGC